MKTKIPFLFLGLSALLLSSCKTSETYGPSQYLVGDFQNLYYTARHDFKDKLGQARSTYVLDSTKYCDGLYGENTTFGANNSSFGPLSRRGLLSTYPELMTYQGQALTTHDAYSLYNNDDDSAYVGTDFGRSKCLSTQNAAFKNEGIISKLYDGQTLCHGTVFRAMFALEKDGIQVTMPKMIKSSDYFLAVVRGGGNTSLNAANCYVKMDIQFTFYFANGSVFDYTTVTLKETYLYRDEGEHANYVGFKFADAGISDVSSIVGWGITYDNVVDPLYSNVKFAPAGADDTYFGLMLYEVMFPDATIV
jgi:hypothetical protein